MLLLDCHRQKNLCKLVETVFICGLSSLQLAKFNQLQMFFQLGTLSQNPLTSAIGVQYYSHTDRVKLEKHSILTPPPNSNVQS